VKRLSFPLTTAPFELPPASAGVSEDCALRLRIRGPRSGRRFLAVLLWLQFLGGTAFAEDTREGLLEVLVSDDFERRSSRILYRLETAEGPLLLDFGGDPPANLSTGDRLRVTGRHHGETFAVERQERLNLRRASDLALADAWTQGPKRALVILVNFADDTSQPYSVPQAQSTVFTGAASVADYFEEISYGQTSLSGDVAGWYTLAITKPTTCNTSAIRSGAEAAAQGAGYVLSNYQFRSYVFPRVPACSWAGLASVRGSSSWINQALSVFVSGHEFGHNYGVLHAHSFDCGAVPFGPTCTRSEYGDPFDIMGGNTRHMQAPFKYSLGWLTDTNTATQSSGSATYTLLPQETLTGGGTRAIRLLTDAGRTYWLEFRQAIGFDASLSGNVNVMNGTLVRLAVGDLLDMTPATNTFGDAALTVGNSWTDAQASLMFTTTAKSGGTLTVDVQYGVTPPTANFTYFPASPLAGDAVAFTNSSTGLPTSFLWDFDDGTTATVQSPTHTFAAGGMYDVTLTAFSPAGASVPFTRTLTVGSATARHFYTIPPCRSVDTRRPFGPFGGPALSAGNQRAFDLTGTCGVPGTARAVAINMTVTQPTQQGDIRIPAGVSLLNFRAGQTRANNAVLAVNPTGQITVQAALAAAGSTHLILDVVGYFE
jgi:PKD domain/Gametolysin peptidase M11